MHFEVLEQLTRDRRAALLHEAEQSRLVAASSVRRGSRRHLLAAALQLLHSRRTSARVETHV